MKPAIRPPDFVRLFEHDEYGQVALVAQNDDEEGPRVEIKMMIATADLAIHAASAFYFDEDDQEPSIEHRKLAQFTEEQVFSVAKMLHTQGLQFIA